VGLPTALILFGCLMAYRYIPPVVSGHVELLETTRDTLEQMEVTLRQSTEMLEILAEASYPDDEFRTRIYSEHADAQDKIDDIHEAVVKQQ
jgi:hypothetical protein